MRCVANDARTIDFESAEQQIRPPRSWIPPRSWMMSDITDYFLAHARQATRKARRMRHGTVNRNRQRVVARVYHLLAKEAAYTPNVDRLDDFRSAQRLERRIGDA